MTLHRFLVALAACLPLAHPAAAVASIDAKAWHQGSASCGTSKDPAIEVFRVDAATYVLRQNECVHFEAPFIYVLFGEHTVFVQDTGATADPARFPLYAVVQELVARRELRPGADNLRMLVTHSHSHADHTAGDSQFRGKPGVTLVEPNAEAVREYFKFAQWPEGTATLDLGGRQLVVIPAPGHQEESIAVYDAKTGWLLTGDSVYPGQLTVKDWGAYRSSIRRLVEFAKTHPVSAVLGTHIEMPGETRLALSVEDLFALGESLELAGAEPRQIAMPKFVVAPVGAFQRVLGGVLKLFLQ